MKTIPRWVLSVILPAALIAQPALGFDYPLSSSAIREAYFLGSGDPHKRTEFFEKYTRHYPVPKSGQYISSIKFETPFAVIVERVSHELSNYFAQDAVREYLGKPAICRIRVEIYFGHPPSGQSTRFQTNYTVRLKQHGKEISAKSQWTENIVSAISAPTVDGINLGSEYDADKIESGSPATVEIATPSGATISETFDLAGLR